MFFDEMKGRLCEVVIGLISSVYKRVWRSSENRVCMSGDGYVDWMFFAAFGSKQGR